MLYEYRLEEADADQTAEIKKEKEAQREKQEKAWKDEEEDSKAQTALNSLSTG